MGNRSGKHAHRGARTLGALLVGLAIGGCSVMGGRAAEEPEYSVLRTDGAIEIREYGALTVASTRVAAANRGKAVSTGFRRLFNYISGANAGASGSGEKIAMTAPVLTQPATEGAEIAMTAPVLSEETEGGWETIFILPDAMTAETAPQPTDPDVTIATIPPRRVAVLTFAGVLGGEAIAERRAALGKWLTREGLAHKADWQAAGYNPPWTIPTFRRNEVRVTLE